jgi:hypothetical protein
MEKQYYMSTNWSPWLAIGFLLSTVFFGIISNGWLLSFLILLSFLPTIVVALALRGYIVLDNNQIKFCYDRKGGRAMRSALNIFDITTIERVGRSLVLHLDDNSEITMRVHEAKELVQDIMQHNPRIELQEK